MKLLTKELEKEFEKLGSQENVKDPIVPTVFFNPTGRGYWFPYHYIPKEKLFFGYVSIHNDWNDEFGYFSLEELENTKVRFGLGIERDMHFSAKPLSEALKEKRVNIPHSLQ